MNNSFVIAIFIGAMIGWVAAGQGKAQPIRLIDVGVLGPLMIFVAMANRPDDFSRLLLAASGAATITFNGRNYSQLKGK